MKEIIKLGEAVNGTLGIDMTQSKTKIEDEVKQLIEIEGKGVTIPCAELITDFIGEIDKYENDLKEREMTIEQMQQEIENIGKVEALFDKIAISNYNLVTKSANEDKKNVKRLVTRLGVAKKVFDKEIEEAKKVIDLEIENAILKYIQDEVEERLLLDCDSDIMLYFEKSMIKAGAVNRGKHGEITTIAKATRDKIQMKLDQSENAKVVIEASEHEPKLYLLYVNNGRDIKVALRILEENLKLEAEAKKREEEKARAEEERRQKEEAEEKERLEQEEKERLAKIEKANAIAKGEIKAEDINDLIVEKTKKDSEKTIAELEHEYFMLEMIDQQSEKDKTRLATLKLLIERKKENDKLRGEEEIEEPIVEEPIVEEPKRVYYKLQRAEKTGLAEWFESRNVNVERSYNVYEIDIEEERAQGFEGAMKKLGDIIIVERKVK